MLLPSKGMQNILSSVNLLVFSLIIGNQKGEGGGRTGRDCLFSISITFLRGVD